MMDITEIRVVPDELVDGFAKLMWTQSYGPGSPTHHVLRLKEGQARSVCNDLTTLFRTADGIKSPAQENIPHHLQMAALRGQVQELQERDKDNVRRIRDLERRIPRLEKAARDQADREGFDANHGPDRDDPLAVIGDLLGGLFGRWR